MRTILTLACLAATVGVAHAQDVKFSGECKAYAASAETCNATLWCKWSVPKKPVVLPTGEELNRTAQCRFRPGFKAAWSARKS
jgi:hypothetical protein